VAIVAGVILLIAGIIGLLALVGDDDERPDAAVVTTTVAPEPTSADESDTTGPGTDDTTGPTTETSPGGPTATTTGANVATTIATGSTTPSSAPSSTAASGAATTAPGTATSVQGGSPATTAPAAQTPEEQRAVALAQELGDALASGRWEAARTLNPGRDESDAFLQQEYGPLVETTVVPASVVETTSGQFDLRLGLVAHEEQPTGRQSVLMCAHWLVNVPANTVTRLSFDRLRVEPGFVDPATRAAELRAACASEK
jgi:hypothetical protein